VAWFYIRVWWCSGLTLKCYKVARDERSSLFCFAVSDREKRFTSLTPERPAWRRSRVRSSESSSWQKRSSWSSLTVTRSTTRRSWSKLRSTLFWFTFKFLRPKFSSVWSSQGGNLKAGTWTFKWWPQRSWPSAPSTCGTSCWTRTTSKKPANICAGGWRTTGQPLIPRYILPPAARALTRQDTGVSTTTTGAATTRRYRTTRWVGLTAGNTRRNDRSPRWSTRDFKDCVTTNENTSRASLRSTRENSSRWRRIVTKNKLTKKNCFFRSWNYF